MNKLQCIKCIVTIDEYSKMKLEDGVLGIFFKSK